MGPFRAAGQRLVPPRRPSRTPRSHPAQLKYVFKIYSHACTSTNTRLSHFKSCRALQYRVSKSCISTAPPHTMRFRTSYTSGTSRNVATPNPTPTHAPIIWRWLTHCGRGLTSMGDSGSPAYLSAGFLSDKGTSAQFTPTPHCIPSPTHCHPTARNNQTLELMRPPGADSHSREEHRLPTQSHAAVTHHGLHVSSVPILTPPSTWDHSGRRVNV